RQRINIPVILLGQCNGSALALQIALRMQEEGVDCRAVCMSGQIPRTKKGPVSDLRNEEQIFSFLNALGASYPVEAEDRIMVLRNLRYDGTLARASYNKAVDEIEAGRFRRLSTPLYCIVGDEDPLTKNYKRRYKAWKTYAEQVELVVIKGVGHYVWRD